MRRLLYPDAVSGPVSAGLLVLRLVVGAAFLFHGWPKVQNPTAWMGPDAPVPGAMQAVAALAEFGGGLALIPGLLTRVAALGIAGVMAVALATVHIPHGDPFVGKPGQASAESAAVYLACVVLLLLAGPGRYSIDALIFGRSPVADAGRPALPRPA